MWELTPAALAFVPHGWDCIIEFEFEPTRRIRNARRKLDGFNPAALLVDDLKQNPAVDKSTPWPRSRQSCGAGDHDPLGPRRHRNCSAACVLNLPCMGQTSAASHDGVKS